MSKQQQAALAARIVEAGRRQYGARGWARLDAASRAVFVATHTLAALARASK